jgi:prevent-host-death family protein
MAARHTRRTGSSATSGAVRRRRAGKARPRAAAKARRGLPGNPANDPARVGVRELRQNLSVYLERVKAGETLTVTAHGGVVAVLAPPLPATGLARLVAEGRATAPRTALHDLPAPRTATMPGAPTAAILDEQRGERLP